MKNRKCGQVTSHCRKAQPYRADLSLFLNVPVVTVKFIISASVHRRRTSYVLRKFTRDFTSSAVTLKLLRTANVSCYFENTIKISFMPSALALVRRVQSMIRRCGRIFLLLFTGNLSRRIIDVLRKCFVTQGAIAWLAYFLICRYLHWILLYITLACSSLISLSGRVTRLSSGFNYTCVLVFLFSLFIVCISLIV